jgi:DDE domain
VAGGRPGRPDARRAGAESRRDKRAAERLSRKLLKCQGRVPRVLITDKLASYSAAKKELMPGVEHRRHKRLNNRAENSHQPTRRRERQMKRFKSPGHVQRFLSAHDQINNLLHLGRDHTAATEYRAARGQAFAMWAEITGTAASGRGGSTPSSAIFGQQVDGVAEVPARALLELGREALDPAEEADVVDPGAAVGEQALEVAVADREPQVSAHGPQDDLGEKRKPRNARASVMHDALGSGDGRERRSYPHTMHPSTQRIRRAPCPSRGRSCP